MTSEVRKLSEPPRRIAALPAFRQSAPASAVTFGRGFVDDADHAERHAHARNLEAVRPRPARDHLRRPDRQAPATSLKPLRHCLDAQSVEPQPVEEGGIAALALGGLEILALAARILLGVRSSIRAAMLLKRCVLRSVEASASSRAASRARRPISSIIGSMLASGLFEQSRSSLTLPLQDHVVAMDHLGAAQGSRGSRRSHRSCGR